MTNLNYSLLSVKRTLPQRGHASTNEECPTGVQVFRNLYQIEFFEF